MSTEIVKTENTEVAEIVDDGKVTLSRTYEFEGKKYSEINTNGLYDITGEDMIQINRILNRSGVVSFQPEMEMEFAFYIAAQATGMPVEFYKKLNMRDSMRVKNRVLSFLFGTESIQ